MADVPSSGSHDDPVILAPIVAALAMIVTAMSGPRKLAKDTAKRARQ
jgi:hypothetical protein